MKKIKRKTSKNYIKQLLWSHVICKLIYLVGHRYQRRGYSERRIDWEEVEAIFWGGEKVLYLDRMWVKRVLAFVKKLIILMLSAYQCMQIILQQRVTNKDWISNIHVECCSFDSLWFRKLAIHKGGLLRKGSILPDSALVHNGHCSYFSSVWPRLSLFIYDFLVT